jgi:phosphonoacetate hydrolase
MPSFTNPNNASILTGGPPSWHGITGNYAYDGAAGLEVPTTDPGLLTAPSLLAKAHAAGCPVAVVTAKEKLLRLLTTGLPSSSPAVLACSIESATNAAASPSAAVLDLARFPRPWAGIYEPDCSVDVLRAGRALVRHLRASSSTAAAPVVAFLSTTDFVQHLHAPEAPEAIEHYSRLDAALGDMHGEGWAITLTADHGMNAKTSADGRINVAWLGGALRAAGVPARVVLPITDAHVKHHGALGGYACVHVGEDAEGGRPRSPPGSAARVAADARMAALLPRAAAALAVLPGVHAVLTREEAVRQLDLPSSSLLLGDLIVTAAADSVLGKSAEEHDLSKLSALSGLRSHGGPFDANTPFLMSWPWAGAKAMPSSDDLPPLVPSSRLRNWHALSLPLHAHGILEAVECGPPQ